MNTEKSQIRVRFAPSPTGPLHIGGVRTALYNYLFAKKNNGQFILRIEDTDQKRYVSQAEDYIVKSLQWLGIEPDEGPEMPGNFGPYRQSERLHLYKNHVDMLIKSGHAYYAFDTPEELEEMREKGRSDHNHTGRYDSSTRLTMRNELSLSRSETEQALQGSNVVVRIKIPADKTLSFNDKIRGKVSFATNELDDKVILKSDGYPTYHMANVVDDKLMRISHVIRGEEWLSSTAHHVWLYKALGWQDDVPEFVHLPLLLKPSGKGKLSKRDGAKFGFPVFPLHWRDNNEDSDYPGFKEEGFLPEAVINFLALMGWNPGGEQEIFDVNELVELFSLEQIGKSGARFNFEKGIWFNQQHIQQMTASELQRRFPRLTGRNSNELEIIDLLKPRVQFISDFESMTKSIFTQPSNYEDTPLHKKYKADHFEDFREIIQLLGNLKEWEVDSISVTIKEYINNKELRFGAIMPVLRIFMTGDLQGPDLFKMMAILGKEEVQKRLSNGLDYAATNRAQTML